LGPELSPNGGDSAEVLLEFGRSGISYETLATRLQEEGATAFVASWKDLLGVIASKTATASKV
jgi:transaldolase